jgi:hypothetical protein
MKVEISKEFAGEDGFVTDYGVTHYVKGVHEAVGELVRETRDTFSYYLTDLTSLYVREEGLLLNVNEGDILIRISWEEIIEAARLRERPLKALPLLEQIGLQQNNEQEQ